MPKHSILWLRKDLRVHDHPALTAALASSYSVAPVFVLDPSLLTGRWASADRTRALLDSLRELRESYESLGGSLIVRRGDPAEVLAGLAQELAISEVHATSDASPYSLARDGRVAERLDGVGARLVRHPGGYCADISAIRTREGRPYTVFSPFGRNWAEAPRREVLPTPESVTSPDLEPGPIPTVGDLGLHPVLSNPLLAGERAGRKRMREWLDDGIRRYPELHNDLARSTSMLSPYLHLGSVSARELEVGAMALPGEGPAAFRRQLGWRDFYAHVMLHNPRNISSPFQSRFDKLEWVDDEPGFRAWCDGRTGYPLVDAGMRELAATGFMHNRTRMVVASFLTKDLHISWQRGEEWFMKLLLDGDSAQNNGNWQWTASLGVDPQPYFKRIFNPTLQQRKFDPDGVYVKRWVPELSRVPTRSLFEPWEMTMDEQSEAGCRIGPDYPAPIVDHAAERQRAVERYRSAADGDTAQRP